MGASQSQQPLYNKISHILPPTHSRERDLNGIWTDVKPFRNEQDRVQFIHSIITILVANYSNKNNNNNKNASSSSSNSNTTTYLATHDFNLLYSRRLRPKPNDNDDGEEGEEEEEFIATLISITPSSGILEAKIEPSASRRGGRRKGGQTHEEAFAAFKRYVEVILGEVSKSVPDAVPDVAAASSSPSEITIEQQQPPPAYEVGRNALSVEGGGGVGKY